MPFFIQKEQPVAVFDSGVGGISVLRELVKVMPNEDFIYYGDSVNAPYGTKTKWWKNSSAVRTIIRHF